MNISLDTMFQRFGPLLVAATGLVALLAGSASAALSSTPSIEQRIMLVQKHRLGGPSGTFVLYALSRGPLEFDSGKYTFTAAEKPYLIRDGQRIAVYIALATLTGRNGNLLIRWRAEFVGAGNGTSIGTGNWSVVRGTGAYAGATGRGRVAVVVAVPRGFTTAQFEGHLRAPLPTS